MIITNPTDQDISITFKGKDYAVEANKSGSVPEDVATFWQSIHKFIGVEAEKKVVAPKVEPVKVELPKEEPKAEEVKKEVKTK